MRRPFVFETSEDVLLLVQVYHIIGNAGEVGGVDLETGDEGIDGMLEQRKLGAGINHAEETGT